MNLIAKKSEWREIKMKFNLKRSELKIEVENLNKKGTKKKIFCEYKLQTNYLTLTEQIH